jgi:hypothetical protein
MHITKRVKVVAGVSALLGVVVAGGAAFTASYLTASGQALAPQYIGGTITQTVTGLVIEDINYGYTDDTDADIDAVQLVFNSVNAVGATVDVTLAFTGDSGTPAVMDCDVVGSVTTASITPDNASNPGADTAGVLSGGLSPDQNNLNFVGETYGGAATDLAYCTAGSNSADTTSLVSVAGVTGISISIGDV